MTPFRFSTAAKYSGISLHAFLIGLIVLSMLPLALLSAFFTVNHYQSLRAERDQIATNIANNVAISIDQNLNARIGALQMLAVSPLVDDASRWRDLYREAQGFYQSFGSHVILSDVGEPMHMLFNTRVPFGERLPLLPRPKGNAAAPTAVNTGKPAVGDIFFGPIAKEPLVAIAVPSLRNGKAAHLLLTIFETRQFQQRIDQVVLPSGWGLSLLDSNGVVIARRTPPDFNPETDTQTAQSFIQKSATSPWSVVLEIPQHTYRKPLITAVTAMLTALLVATLASLLGGILASRRLARAVASLSETTPPATPVPDIREIAQARRMLDETNEKRRQTEIVLDDSEKRFHAIFEQAAVGLALIAPDGHWLQVNDKLCEIVGYTREELAALSFQDITHPDDLETDLVHVNQMLAGEISSYAMEKRYLRKDGYTVWINLTVALIWKPDGTPDYFISVIEDIQARKDAEHTLAEAQAAALQSREEERLAALNQMEDALAARKSAELANAALCESQEQLQLFIEHAPAALAMFDCEMRYLAVSRRWLDDYFLGKRNILGHSHYEIFPEIAAPLKAVHRRGLAGEIIRADEERFERADGNVLWLRWEMRPWHTAEGAIGGIVIFSEDVTARVLARQEILQLNASLEQRVLERTAELSAANQELDSFAYAVSHDLRAPLRAMKGFAQALQEDYGDRLNGEAKGYLDQIGIASRKMGELIEGILALSRSTRGDLQCAQVDLSALATSILAELAHTEPERSVAADIEPGLVVHGDDRMIEAVMRNLLGNAWKYTSKTPTAAIRVHAGEIDGRHAVCVTDNGAGFDMAHAGQLFQPFRRLHREDEFPGIGIGLATVQRIVHRHGGKINVQAVPSKGATFCFTLAEKSGVTS